MKTRKIQLELMRNFSKENSDYKELTNAIIDIIEDESEGLPIEYMKGVFNHGCISGWVSSLIYYSQTDKFFKEHIDDIFTIYNELREELGDCPIRKDFDVNANSLSWMAFEEINRILLDMLEKELNT